MGNVNGRQTDRIKNKKYQTKRFPKTDRSRSTPATSTNDSIEPIDVSDLLEVQEATEAAKKAWEIVRLLLSEDLVQTVGDPQEHRYIISIEKKDRQKFEDAGITRFTEGEKDYVKAEAIIKFLAPLLPAVQKHINNLSNTQSMMTGEQKEAMREAETNNGAIGIQKCKRIISVHNRVCRDTGNHSELFANGNGNGIAK